MSRKASIPISILIQVILVSGELSVKEVSTFFLSEPLHEKSCLVLVNKAINLQLCFEDPFEPGALNP